MKIKIPANVPHDQRDTYRRGFQDGVSSLGRKGGSVSSQAKAEAARLNGLKPKKLRERKPSTVSTRTIHRWLAKGAGDKADACRAELKRRKG